MAKRMVDSFKNEVGKNTGKYVSNLIFGDKHATPHKLVRDVKKQHLEEKHKLELDEKKKARINQLKQATNEKVLNISKIQIPASVDEQVELMNELYVHIQNEGWKSIINGGDEEEKEDRLGNKVTDALFKKYKKVFKTFSISNQEHPEYLELKKHLSRMRFKRIFGKYWVIILFVAIFMFLIIAAIIGEK